MNDVMMKGMMKILKNFISPDQIKAGANSLIQSAIDYKKNIKLDQGETEAAAIFYEHEGKVFFSIAIFRENEIVRQENTQPIENFIDEFLKNI